MNDRRFQELLNLYLDHEIAPAEAAELETEVLGNPARRRTYDQYCRLQRGCRLLGGHAGAHAPDSQGFARSLRDVERKLSAPRREVPVWRTAYAGAFATAAMAACVAVVFVVSRQPQPAAGSAAVLAGGAQPVPVRMENVVPVIAVATTAVQPVADARFEFQPMLASSGLGVVRNAREAEIAKCRAIVAEKADALWRQVAPQIAALAVKVDSGAASPEGPASGEAVPSPHLGYTRGTWPRRE